MFKNNKIMYLWLMSLATTSVAAHAEMKEETITVTQGVSEEPTAPVKGIVATDQRGDCEDAAVGIGDHPRSNEHAGRHIRFAGAALLGGRVYRIPGLV